MTHSTHITATRPTQPTRPAIRSSEVDGVVTLVMDSPVSRVNKFDDEFIGSLSHVVDSLEDRAGRGLRGVLLTSAKSSFVAGGDLLRLLRFESATVEAFEADLQFRKGLFRRLERLGVPVVAVLAGPAMGGGLELALACHYRVAVTDLVTVALPEVGYGLLPGAGGLVRGSRLIGADAMRRVALSGAKLDAREALELGLVDALACDVTAAERIGHEWIAAHPVSWQPWDGGPVRPQPRSEAGVGLSNTHVLFPIAAMAPASAEIAAVIGAAEAQSVDDDLERESHGIARLVVSPQAKRSIEVGFVDVSELRQRYRDGERSRERIHLRASVELIKEYRDIGLDRAFLLTAEDIAWSPEAIRLTAANLRLEEDRSAAGQKVASVVVHDDAWRAVASALLSVGVLPIRSSAHGLSEVVASASAKKLAALVSAGELAPGQENEVKVDAGLLPAPLVSLPAPDRAGLLDQAAQLITAIATAVIESRLVVEDDWVDLASVRLGGLPPWTGGARRWLDSIRSADARR